MVNEDKGASVPERAVVNGAMSVPAVPASIPSADGLGDRMKGYESANQPHIALI